MSKNNNVNPGHYKVGGRLKMGEPGTQDRDRQQLAKANERTPRRRTTSAKKAAAPKRGVQG